MVAFGIASVVLIDFPFSDLSRTKSRPAVILAQAGNEDWVLCQVTSNAKIDTRVVEINSSDFAKGSLQRTSHARPNKIFTGHESLITKRVGILKKEKLEDVIRAVIEILKEGTK